MSGWHIPIVIPTLLVDSAVMTHLSYMAYYKTEKVMEKNFSPEV